LFTLSLVLIFIPGQATQRTPLYGVNGSDIKDLQILPEATSAAAPLDIQPAQYQQQRIPPQTAKPPPQAMPKPPTARNVSVAGKQIVYDARAKKVDESSATESAVLVKQPKKKKGKQLPPEPIVSDQATTGACSFERAITVQFLSFLIMKQCNSIANHL
jgi:hypothetical protein